MPGSPPDHPSHAQGPQFYSQEEIANSPSLKGKTRSTQGSDPHTRSFWTDQDRPGESDPGLRYGDAQPRRDNPAPGSAKRAD